MSRGLYRSNDWISIEIPEGTSYEDLVVLDSSDRQITIIQNDDGEYGFYLYKGKTGDGISGSSNFRIGAKEDTFAGKTITIKSNLERLYNDESEYVYDSFTTNDRPRTSLDLYIEYYESISPEYRYDFDGYSYRISKRAPYSYNGEGVQMPSEYRSRLQATRLYDGAVIPFTITGSVSRNYKTSTVTEETQTTNDDKTEEFSFELDNQPVANWNDINWYENDRLASVGGLKSTGETYKEIYQDANDENNTSEKKINNKNDDKIIIFINLL